MPSTATWSRCVLICRRPDRLVWVVKRLRFDQEYGTLTRRRDEVMRLPGDMPVLAVAGIMELRYAAQYQPEWTESATPHERAEVQEGMIRVGHEPQFLARLVAEDS